MPLVSEQRSCEGMPEREALVGKGRKQGGNVFGREPESILVEAAGLAGIEEGHSQPLPFCPPKCLMVAILIFAPLVLINARAVNNKSYLIYDVMRVSTW